MSEPSSFPGPWRGSAALRCATLCALLSTIGPLLSPVAGQEKADTGRVTIHGTVIDQESGEAVPGASIRFTDTDFHARSDSLGRFTLTGLLRGAYYLVVEAQGYEARGGTIQVIRSGNLTLPLEATDVWTRTDTLPGAPAGGKAGPTSRIVGRVVEMETGKAVEGAEVRLTEDAGTRVTDGRGHFEFERVAGGLVPLSVSHLGRAPVEDSVRIIPGTTVELAIRLAVEPVELDPMIVVATLRDPYLVEMGFFKRREMGYNVRQITRQLIEERDPRSLGDLLVSVPGVRVDFGGPGGIRVRMGRVIRLDASGEAGCVPAVYLDDVPVDVGWLQDIPPDRVAGMEIFSGANTPIQYSDPCGLILVWTRRGERGGRGS
mgnify:CR=1 FL=1